MKLGTSFIGQLVRLNTHARGPGFIPGQGARFLMPQLMIPHAQQKDVIASYN